MKSIIKENLIKNIILAVIIILLIFPISNFLINANLDKALAGDVLVAVSVIAVIACFGNFAFTYEKINLKNTLQRYMAHFVTGLLMFVVGVSLIFTAILIKFLIGHFILIDISLILLYLACVGYDFWDLLRF